MQWIAIVQQQIMNKFAPRALRQDRRVLRHKKPKTARYAKVKNTIYSALEYTSHAPAEGLFHP